MGAIVFQPSSSFNFIAQQIDIDMDIDVLYILFEGHSIFYLFLLFNMCKYIKISYFFDILGKIKNKAKQKVDQLILRKF